MTMILAHVLPDRRSGFIMADRRWTDVEQQAFADCGGKVLPTPLGWAAGTTLNARPLTAAYAGLRSAGTMQLHQMLMPVESRRFLLEHIIGLELITDRLPLEPDPESAVPAQHATMAILEATETGLALFVVNAARAVVATEYGNVASDDGEAAQAAIGAAFLEAMTNTPATVEARIIAAARCFTLARARYKSDDVSVGYVAVGAENGERPTALRKRFMEGDAHALASSTPEEIFERFRAEAPSLTGGEKLSVGIATLTPFGD